MMYDLPTTVEVCGKTYDIRSDYRAVLDICAVLEDGELDEQDKIAAILDIFYPSFVEMPPVHYGEALSACFRFIDCEEGEEAGPSGPKLMDWERDFRYIVAPVNRVLGREIRDVEYLHWWSFVAAYREIGDCLFAQIVRIRERKAKGKPLDKADAEWYRRNRGIVDLKTTYTEEDNELLKKWGV